MRTMKIFFVAAMVFAISVNSVEAKEQVAPRFISDETANPAIYEASYRGVVEGDSLRWSGTLKIGATDRGNISIPLPSPRAVLVRMKLDRRTVPVITSDNKWIIPLTRSRRRVRTLSWTALSKWHDEGDMRLARLNLPPSPIAKVLIEFPGKGIEAKIDPGLGVITKARRKGGTILEASLPHTEIIIVTWNRPTPELQRAEAEREALRARAESNTRIRYSDGVLEAEDVINWTALTGTASSITFKLPTEWEVTSISSESVQKWTVREVDESTLCELTLKPGTRKVEFTSRRELILSELPVEAIISAPIISEVESHRGTIAIERSNRITTEVVEIMDLIRTDATSLTMAGKRPPAQAYRFAKAGGAAIIRINEPRILEAELRASITNLLIIEKEILRVWAEVNYAVTRSTVDSFRVKLPVGTRVTTVRSKYLEEYKTTAAPDAVIVDVQLYRSVKGRHKVAIDYEQVLMREGDIEFPFIEAMDVKSIKGEIGVETRENIEIEGEKTENVQRIDITRISPDIPKRATRPLLAAYAYSRVAELETPLKLRLNIKRHIPVDVKEAVADQASFETLALIGGGHITQAIFGIRNKGRQFMRITLPPGAKVWSAFIAGEPVNPSRDGASNVLIPLAKSAEENGRLMAFPVKIVYQTPGKPLRGIGFRRFDLPKVDLTISSLVWKAILPDGSTFMRTGGTIEAARKKSKQRKYARDIAKPFLIAPNFLKFQAKARQSEAKTNLASIATAQISFFAENGRYGRTFDEIGWAPTGNTRYAYFMGRDAILGGSGPQSQLPPFPLEISNDHFVALAVGNIDGDPKDPDIWIIDEDKTPRNIANDLNDTYSEEYNQLKQRGMFNHLDSVIQVASVETAQSSGVLPIDIDIPEGGTPHVFVKLFPTEDNLPTWVSFLVIPKRLVRSIQVGTLMFAVAFGAVIFRRRKKNGNAPQGPSPEQPAPNTPPPPPAPTAPDKPLVQKMVLGFLKVVSGVFIGLIALQMLIGILVVIFG